MKRKEDLNIYIKKKQEFIYYLILSLLLEKFIFFERIKFILHK